MYHWFPFLLECISGSRALSLFLGGGGGGNQARIDHRAGLEEQAALAQQRVDGGQNGLAQFVLFQAVAKAQDGRFIGQTLKLRQLRKLAVQGHVEEGLFHGRVGQGEPLLHEVDTEHGLQRERWPAVPAFGVVRCNEADQLGPGNDLFHLLEELALAGLLALQIKIQSNLFDAMYFIAEEGSLHGNLGGYAEFPKG